MAYKLTWFGHAAFGLETGGCQLLVDPFFTDNPAATVRAEDVTADFILVTHGHDDHLGDTLEISRRTNATVIAVTEIGDWLKKRGAQTHRLQIGGGHAFPFGYLKMTLALHTSSLPDGSYGGNPAGFLLTTLQGEKIYFAGDTGLFGDMRLIGEEGVHLAVLPVGDNFTMGPADALRAVKLLQPQHVLPVHYNTWDIIQQDNLSPWAGQVQAETGAQVHLLSPGQSLQF
jgi:L-ascorbate metabolism protein UlaG (beta-lactamase superfamily)